MMRTLPMLTAVILSSSAVLADDFPNRPGHDLVASACTQCHGAGQVTSQRLSRDGWADTVARMVANGAPINDTDQGKITDYLAASFPAK